MNDFWEENRGRPSKIHDPDIVRRLLDNIRLGMPQKYAALDAGISDRTFDNWKRRAKSGDPEYEDFFRELKKAESSGMKMSLTNIQIAANPEQFRKDGHKGQWQAAAWILERRFKKDFGREAVVEEEPEPEGVDLSEMSEEDLQTMQKILNKYADKRKTDTD